MGRELYRLLKFDCFAQMYVILRIFVYFVQNCIVVRKNSCYVTKNTFVFKLCASVQTLVGTCGMSHLLTLLNS